MLERAPSAHDAAARLLASALSTDDLDNITALVARVAAGPANGTAATR
jgi:hypothetical protein